MADLQSSVLRQNDPMSNYRLRTEFYGPSLFEDYSPAVASEKAVSGYVESSRINRFARGEWDREDAEGFGIDDPEDRLGEIDDAIERNHLVEDTLVYRGVSPGVWQGDLNPGDQILDRGYLSTSISPNTASAFGNDILEIDLPMGTHAALASPHETELLLGRGSVLEVGEVEILPSGHRLIRTRLVGYVDD